MRITRFLFGLHHVVIAGWHLLPTLEVLIIVRIHLLLANYYFLLAKYLLLMVCADIVRD